MKRNENGSAGEVEYDLTPDVDVLRGHFPGDPIFPGVLQIEAAAQACCWIYLVLLPPGTKPADVRFVSVDKYKFKRPVAPPCTLTIRGQEISRRGTLYYWGVEVLMNGEVVSEGSFWLKLVNPPVLPENQA